jgi:hypothetical protein
VQRRSAIPFSWRRRISEAKIWSRKLWLLTGLVSIFILGAENYTYIFTQVLGQSIDAATVDQRKVITAIFQSLVPFAYGGLGATAYLLRSVHEYIYKRTFDPSYMPEYYNRILLGIISGGAIQLFISKVAGDGGSIVKISAAAVAFIAGYNSDFLFSAVERVSAAVLPKVGIDSLQAPLPAPPTITEGMLTNLASQLDKAQTPEAKAALNAVIDKLKDRL